MSLTNELPLTKGENHVIGPNKVAVRKLNSQENAYLFLYLMGARIFRNKTSSLIH